MPRVGYNRILARSSNHSHPAATMPEDHQHESLIKTPKQLAIVVALAFLVPITVIGLLSQLVTSGVFLDVGHAAGDELRKQPDYRDWNEKRECNDNGELLGRLEGIRAGGLPAWSRRDGSGWTSGQEFDYTQRGALSGRCDLGAATIADFAPDRIR